MGSLGGRSAVWFDAIQSVELWPSCVLLSITFAGFRYDPKEELETVELVVPPLLRKG
jgi:hypothetical protein